MKPEIECLRCILSVRLKEIEQVNLNSELKLALAKKLMLKVIEEFSWNIELTEFASELFKYVVAEVPEVTEYYKALKRLSNKRALENVPLHKDYVLKLSDYRKFNYLTKLAAVANLIDYGVAEHKPLEHTLSPEFVENYAVFRDDSRSFYNLITKGGLKIAWLFDNAGEAVYDTLLISEIRSWGNVVYGFVKDEPGFQNDVSVSDVEYLGLNAVIDEIRSYGCNCSTIHLNHIAGETRVLIEESDIIVAKGMSHFEYLSEVNLEKPVVFILVPKCDPVAKRFSRSSKGKIVILVKT